MKKEGMKSIVLIMFILVFSIISLNTGLVFAQEKDNFNTCQEYCWDFMSRMMPACPGNLEISGNYPDCNCNWVCIREYKDLEKEYEDEEIVNPGITPDSAFYFIDEFFSLFGDEIGNKEEKIAEIKAMIEKGDFESAHQALERYREYANELEKESDPDKKEEAKRSAIAIRNALDSIRDDIPKDKREDFYEDIIEKERGILTGVEISSKIKRLCMQLSELDPMEYSRMCKTDEEDPKWQKKLHKELTKEQKKIAKNFIKTMKQCFKTSGQDCNCEEIPFTDFANACSEAAPLAVACDIKNDERACEKLENLEMPELPDYLQEIFDDLEGEMNEEQYKMHMPRECVEAGARSPKDCGRIMIQTHAPEECKEALLAANPRTEKEGREICDRIMMEIHSPECVEQGITDPEECARKMMPPECEGMDPRECRDYMDNMRGDHFGPRIDFNCQNIEDPTERLECYDKAASQAQGYQGMGEDYEGNCMTESDWDAKKRECREMYGEHAGDEPIMGDSGQGWECVIDARCIDFSQGKLDFEDIKEKERQCANECEAKGGHWDFSYGDCKCYVDDYSEYEYEDRGPGCDDCSSQCPGASGTDCVNDRCQCYYEDDEPDYDSEYEEPTISVTEPTESTTPDETTETTTESDTDSTETTTESSETTTESSSSESSSSDSSSESSSDSGSSESENSGITGGVIFWEYFTG
jgi:hypothetical protein